MSYRENCWQILDIEPTENARLIKRAYAQKLKTIDIDNEPTVFQELKQAFDAALDYYRPANQHLPEEPQESVPLTELNSFTEQLESLLFSQEDYFCDLSPWQELITANNQLDLEQLPEAQSLIADCLNQNHYWFSLAVREYLLQFCQVGTEQSDPQGYRDWAEAIRRFPDFDFSFAQEIAKEDRHNYFELRGRIYLFFSSNFPLQQIGEKIAECKAIYPQDSTLTIYDCYLTLLHDHGFRESETFMQMANYLKILTDFPGRSFIEHYFFYFSAYGSQAGPLKGLYKKARYFYNPYNEPIPSGIYHLLVGSIAYFDDNREKVNVHWHDFEEDYWPVLAAPEREYLAGGKLDYDDHARKVKYFTEATLETDLDEESQAEPEKALGKKYWLWFVVAFFIFRLIRFLL